MTAATASAGARGGRGTVPVIDRRLLVGTVLSDGVGFTVPAGALLALTGASGAAKSSVLALLERFIRPRQMWEVDRPAEDEHYRRAGVTPPSGPSAPLVVE